MAIHDFKRGLQKSINQLPFRYLLMVVFGLMLVLTVLSTSILLIMRGNQVTDSVITKLAHYTSHDVSLEIARFLDAPKVINRTTKNAIQAKRVDPEDLDSISRFLWESTRRTIDFSFSSIYYATKDGSFISVGVADTHHPGEERVFSYATQSNGGRYGDYRANDDGTMGELFEFHGEFDPRVRPWYKTAVSNPNQPVWSDIYLDFDTKFATLTHAMSVQGDDGDIIGVAAVDLFLDHMQDYLAGLDLTEHSEAFVIDERGKIICAYAPAIRTPQPDHNIAASDSPYPFTRASVAYFDGRTKSDTEKNEILGSDVTLEGVDGYLLFTPVGREQGVEWTMGIFIPRSDFTGDISDQIKSQMVLISLVLLLSILTVWGFIAIIVKPIHKLKDEASQIAAGRFDVCLETDSNNEVGELAKSIDAMQKRLKFSFESLVAEKSRVMTTLESIEDGVIALDSKDQITFMNASAMRQTGWSLLTTQGQPITELTVDRTGPDEEQMNQRALLKTVVEFHSQSEQSIQTLNPLLEDNPLSCRLSLVINDEGLQTGSVLVFNNMSELLRLKIRHEEVEAAESRLSRIVEESLNEIYMFDPHTLHIIMTNRAARDNLGYSIEETLTLTAFDVMMNLDKNEAEKLVSPFLNGGREIHYYESIHIRKDGTTYPTETRLHYMRDESPPLLVAIVHDHTVRSQRLADVLLRDRAIAEVGVGVLICDAQQSDHPMVYVNPAIEKITGFLKSDLIGKNPRLLLGDNKYQLKHKNFQSALNSLQTAHMTLQSHRKDGSKYTAETFFFPVHDESNVITHHIGIINDATERLKTEMHLRHAQKFDAIGQLSGGIAHDFNNMLSIISGRLELLDIGVQEESLRQHVREAGRAVDMGAELTRRLLSFARKSTLEPKPINMNDCVTNVLLLLRPTLNDNITVSHKLEERLWTVCVDPSEVDNMLVNLAINARDAMPEGGDICISTLNESAERDQFHGETVLVAGEYVKLTVTDTGTGIDQTTLSRLFEPFFTTKPLGQGNGLGLASIFGFTEQSGGTITVDSQLGAGTSFHVYLPRYKGNSLVENPDQTVHQGSFDKSSNDIGMESSNKKSVERVLVVEDNQDLRALVVTQLLSLGFDVVQTENGCEALELIESGADFDLVFCDVSMPGGIDGYEVAEWIEKNRQDCKVVLTSGFNENSTVNGDQASSVWPLLKKPYRIAELQYTIESVLCKK